MDRFGSGKNSNGGEKQSAPNENNNIKITRLTIARAVDNLPDGAAKNVVVGDGKHVYADRTAGDGLDLVKVYLNRRTTVVRMTSSDIIFKFRISSSPVLLHVHNSYSSKEIQAASGASRPS